MKEFKSKSFIDHLSYSAVRSFCVSPAQFYKFYVMREEFPPSLSMLAGSAWHAGVEEYYRNGPAAYIGAAVDKMLEGRESLTPKEIGMFDKEIEGLKENLKLYPSLRPETDNIDVIERKVSMPSPVEGGAAITGVIDLIDKHGNPVDHKYKGRYTHEGPQKYMIQAWFYYYLTKEVTGKYPAYFQIDEFKKTPNRDGSEQLRAMVLMYEDKWIKKVDDWYVELTQQIMGQKYFIPNPFQFFGGEDWDEYINS